MTTMWRKICLIYIGGEGGGYVGRYYLTKAVKINQHFKISQHEVIPIWAINQFIFHLLSPICPPSARVWSQVNTTACALSVGPCVRRDFENRQINRPFVIELSNLKQNLNWGPFFRENAQRRLFPN